MTGNEQQHPFSNEEMRLAELLHQFLALSDDQDIAGRITFRGPKGEYIGETTLSVRDIEAATEALTSVNAYRQQAGDAGLKADTLPQVDEADVDEVMAGLHAILNPNGGQQ